MKYRFIAILIALSCLPLAINVARAESAAFGFFINESNNESYDYLEKILPNSFASALNNKYKFSIIKPGQIPVFKTIENGLPGDDVKEENLPAITQLINADYFIYGSFKPLEDNKIKLNIVVYKKGTSSVFQFEETGYLETEIFRMVDRITVQIKNIASDSMYYKSENITSKSKVAIFTNIEGEKLNSLYLEFLNNGYKITPTQGNELYSSMNNDQIKNFYHISGVNASFHRIHDKKDIELFYSSWQGPDKLSRIREEKKIYEKYLFNFLNTKNEIFKKLKSANEHAIDYLIIIGFDENRTNAWVRCLNIKDNKLLFTKTGISGSSVDEIAKKIILGITSGTPENM